MNDNIIERMLTRIEGVPHGTDTEFDPKQKPGDVTCVIPWSGGLDSTYLVLRRLLQGYTVYAPYIQFNNMAKGKIAAENVARQKIADIIRNKFPDLHLHYRVPDVYMTFTIYDSDTLYIPQHLAWLYAMSTYKVLYSKPAILELAYVCGDSVIPILPHMRKLWKDMTAIIRPPHLIQHYPEITFPLVNVSKSTIMECLPKEILKCVHTCEMSDVPCGKCVPCLALKSAECISGISLAELKGNELNENTCIPKEDAGANHSGTTSKYIGVGIV